MLLSLCPNCEHENAPGEQFCAKCGVPLNLKPCPHCGKVDQITATVCAGCGMSFPPLRPAPVPDTKTAKTAPPARAVTPAPVAGNPPPATNRALPLILVALAAGGLPLLWMNRAHMPLPKAWQIAGPNAAGSAVPVPPPAAIEVVAPTPLASSPPVTLPVAPAPAADAAPTAARKLAAAPAVTRAVAPRPAPRRDAAKPTEGAAPGRPCTEALAALGLCDPKSIGK